MSSRIAIVVPYSALDTIPSLCAAIELLVERGYYIDIFTRVDEEFLIPTFNTDKIRVFASKMAGSRSPYLRRFKVLLDPFFKSPFKKLLDESLLPPLSTLLQRHKEIAYKAIIGVDPEGLRASQHIVEMLHLPLIYWSFELLLSKEVADKNWRILKECELKLSHRADIIVIQDEERAKLLAMDNNLSINKFLLIPNAPIGSAQVKPTKYWHQLFGLKEDQRIVLYSGSLGNWTGIRKIISSVNDWPENWALVVHTRYNSDKDYMLHELKIGMVPNRVFFSTQPVSRNRYPDLVSGADIGIAFYLPHFSPFTQENIRAIGLSSGKIAYYLRAGLPIIVNKWPSISKLVENERCGVVVESATEIGNAIIKITQGYQDYQNNASKVFEKYLEPLNSIKQFIKYIDNF